MAALVAQVAVLPGQSAGPFTSAGNMTMARAWHTATLLPDGRVLIAGGLGAPSTGIASEILSSAEIYDPSTDIFIATGNMTIARASHTATLLANGKVLIAGGENTLPGSAELYDPSTGTFTPTPKMSADGSYFHTATLLPDGRVLFVAQVGGSGAQIYDPASGVFAPTGSPLAAPFGWNAATILTNGQVLLLQESETEGEVYDPVSGTFSRTWPRIPWVQGTATLLLNGQVLLAGGNDDFGISATASVYTSTNLYRNDPPPSGAFGPTGNMTGKRAHSAATLLPDGNVLITGSDGPDFTYDGFESSLASAELYDGSVFNSAGNMTTPRGFHTATLLNNGKVLVAGGLQASGGSYDITLQSAELYTPASLVRAPILYSLSGNVQGPGAIWDAATGAVVTPGHPAIAGEVLAMYTANLAKGGLISPLVIVGGEPCEVVYFGPAPGYPGYSQVNFRVPSNVAPGSAVPVRLVYLDRSSNDVTIAIQ